jgi:hypothetical protein
MDTFAAEWTYRDPETTVTYPAGHKENLPAHIQLAARKARVLIIPTLETSNGNDGRASTPRSSRRSHRAKE